MNASNAPWLRFAELCETVSATSGKLTKRAAMAEFLQPLDAPTAGMAAQYLTGTPFPETDERRLQVGSRQVVRALEAITNASPERFSAVYRKHGDLGSAAEELLLGVQPESKLLGIREIAARFDALAAARKQSSKSAKLLDLLHALSPLEAKYCIKLMLGDMRMGVKQSLVEEAVAVAAEEELPAVRRAEMMLGDISAVVALAWRHELSTARFQMFHPLGFMLATPAASAEEAYARFVVKERAFVPVSRSPVSPFEDDSERPKPSAMRRESSMEGTASDPIGSIAQMRSPAQIEPSAQIEDKYDGMRAQIHCGDPAQPGRVRIFSRTREDVTASFPELAEWFAAVGTPAILDGEILAWDFAADRALPFTALQPRLGRKVVTPAMRADAPAIYLAFDLLLDESGLLLDAALRERRTALESWIGKASQVSGKSRRPVANAAMQGSLFETEEVTNNKDAPVRLKLAPITPVVSPEQIDETFGAAQERGNEGLMLKSLASTYQPGRRGSAWIKLKRELATLDVVVTAVEYGHGRRAAVLSDYTFAVQDGTDLKNVGKAYSGLTDKEISTLTQWFLNHRLEDARSGQFLVEPKIVLEVAFNNVMQSDRHSSGFALRFPRIVRIRGDKPVEEIDTLDRVAEIFRSQTERKHRSEDTAVTR